MRLLALATALLLTGCAQTVWVKNGSTVQDFNRDTYECERDMRQSGYYGTGTAGAINAQGYQERCMYARGWSLQRKQ